MDFIDTNGDYFIDQNLDKLKKYNDSHIFKTSETIENVHGVDSQIKNRAGDVMLDLKTSRYFNSLPKGTQEIVSQSGIDFESEDELLDYTSGLDI